MLFSSSTQQLAIMQMDALRRDIPLRLRDIDRVIIFGNSQGNLVGSGVWTASEAHTHSAAHKHTHSHTYTLYRGQDCMDSTH